MSDMLEQAIIDADALKMAATKNAETLVLEKYSNQIKNAVESLLEQDDPMADLESELTQAADAATPDTPTSAPEEPVEKSSVMEHIPLAATSTDSEQIEIPLDKLMEEINNLNESMRFAGPFDSVEEDLYEDDADDLYEEDEDLILGDMSEEGFDEDYALGEGDFDALGEYDLEEGQEGSDDEERDLVLRWGAYLQEEDPEGFEASGGMEELLSRYERGDIDIDMLRDMAECPDGELCEDPAHPEDAPWEQPQRAYESGHGMLDDDMMEDEIDEDIYEAISEALEVDIHPQKSGWQGMPEAIVNLAEEEILALEQDSEVREEREAMRKAAKKLQEANQALVGKNKDLKGSLGQASDLVTRLKEAITVLDHKLAESSLKNAKLVYQNKALTSDSLNERQKRKLAEAVVNAESIEEAKVIFETLQSTVGSTSRKKQPKSLSEAVQKSSSMILTSRERKETRQKNNPTLDRWKFLAGIDK